MHSTPDYYEICVGGRLSEQAAIWFEDMTLTVNEDPSPPQTIIRGYMVDQAALFGLISRIRDLGLTLISVQRLDEAGEGEPQTGRGDASEKIKDHPPTDKD